jgi:hypothetical protein
MISFTIAIPYDAQKDLLDNGFVWRTTQSNIGIQWNCQKWCKSFAKYTHYDQFQLNTLVWF